MARLKEMAMNLPEMAKLSENIMQQVCSYEDKINRLLSDIEQNTALLTRMQ